MLVMVPALFISSIIARESFDINLIDINFILIIFYMGFIVSVLTIFFQNWAQKVNKNPTLTGIIFNLEPVFAVIFAFLIGNETLSWLELIGCAIIFFSIFIAVYEKNRTQTEMM